MIYKSGIVSILLAVSTGCASITDGTIESAEFLTFLSEPSGAAIKLPGRTLCITPCERRVAVHLMQDMYAEVDGYPPVSLSPDARANANVIGNIVFGGAIGVGLDLLTGRAVRFDDVIKVDFEPYPHEYRSPVLREYKEDSR